MCAVVRECIEGLSGDLVVSERKEFNEQRDKLDSELAEMLVNLEKRVKPEGAGSYWLKKT